MRRKRNQDRYLRCDQLIANFDRPDECDIIVIIIQNFHEHFPDASIIALQKCTLARNKQSSHQVLVYVWSTYQADAY